jgi:hypothetical protein
MPFALTYTSLVTALQQYMQRYDALVTENIPLWIALAQQRIPRELKLLGFRTEVTGTFDGAALSTGLMQKPSDWRQTIAFYVGTGTSNNVHTPVYERTYEFIRTVYPDPTQQATPRFYADADYNHWLLGPSPVSALPFKIAYYGTLTLLDDTTQTNWLTENAPDLLLYACLVEAIPFVKADERIQVWTSMYQNAKAALQAQDIEGLFDAQQIAGKPDPTPAPGR